MVLLASAVLLVFVGRRVLKDPVEPKALLVSAVLLVFAVPRVQ